MRRKIIGFSIFMSTIIYLAGCTYSDGKKRGGEEYESADIAAVETACLNYVGGWFESDIDRMKISLHPQLAKRWVKNGSELVGISFEKLLEYAASPREKAKNGVQVKVLDISDNMATAVIFSDYVDHVQLAKLDDQWMVLNVIWDYKHDGLSRTSDDETAIENACMNYVGGWFSSQIDRMKESIHPRLVKRWIKKGEQFSEINLEKLLEYAESPREPAKNGVKVTILDIHHSLATARVDSDYIDYVHLGKLDGEWMIINVIWDYAKS